MGIGPITEGTSRLYREYTKEPWAVEALARGQSKARDPERCRKIAEAKRGMPRPPHVLEAMHRAWRGSHHSEESRRKMSETRRKRGILVPGTVVWTVEEDELLKTLPAAEVAKRTGRTLTAIYTRRRRLGMLDGRRRD